MRKQCKTCGENFEVSEEDMGFYDRVSPTFDGKKFQVPPPLDCPECRLKRRLSWRNERNLFKRKCDATGEMCVSCFSPDKPQKIYQKDYWLSDKWDAKDYGKDFDFDRPFFDQLRDLINEAPWFGLLADKTVNSDYVNFCLNVKNCYLTFGSNNNEDCMHGSYLSGCEDCVDILHADDCKFCYEGIDLTDCYDCKYCKSCSNCSELKFCENCQNCRNCFGCVNLVGKQYYFLNEKLSREEYEKRVNAMEFGSYSQVSQLWGGFEKHRLKYPMRGSTIVNCDDCSGDAVRNSKNVQDAYDISDAEDSRWILLGHGGIKDCYDTTGIEDLELCYYCICCGAPASRNLFCAYTWSGVHDLYYCILSPHSRNSFGCFALRRGEYCILNKQYSKIDYEKMVARIVEHMVKTGEWGEFFPADFSPFGYNETNAQDYFPSLEDEVLARGYKWSDYENEVAADGVVEAESLPDKIQDVGDDILNVVIKCDFSGRPFKVVPAELRFYRRQNIPLPRLHPDERHKRRMGMRNSRKLWDRKCAKCEKKMSTTYSPKRPETIYCEDCFRAEVY